MELGELLLLDRDFTGAREAFNRARDLVKKSSINKDMLDKLAAHFHKLAKSESEESIRGHDEADDEADDEVDEPVSGSEL